MHHHVEELEERSIFNCLSKFSLSERGNAVISTTQRTTTEDSLDTLDLLVVLNSGVAQLGSGSGNKDLISSQVSSSGVVLTVLMVSVAPIGQREKRTEIRQEW